MQWKSTERIAFLALLGGAAGIGFAPIFVRLSEVGPSATAFYRLLFALPVLYSAAAWESRNPARARANARNNLDGLGLRSRLMKLCGLAGLLFAGDLAFWHWSIKLTSVANSTLLTNCTPFVVMLGARILFAERMTRTLVLGMVLAALGAALLVGASFQLTMGHLLGDFLALITAFFYGGYLLTVKYLRKSLSVVQILAWSGAVSCALLFLIAILSQESLGIHTFKGWIVLLSLGIVSHLGGQGLITYALAHLPAGFSSVGLLLQPVIAAVLAWLILAEPLTLLQSLGGVVILIGIAFASFNQSVS